MKKIQIHTGLFLIFLLIYPNVFTQAQHIGGVNERFEFLKIGNPTENNIPTIAESNNYDELQIEGWMISTDDWYEVNISESQKNDTVMHTVNQKITNLDLTSHQLMLLFTAAFLLIMFT